MKVLPKLMNVVHVHSLLIVVGEPLVMHIKTMMSIMLFLFNVVLVVAVCSVLCSVCHLVQCLCH